MMLSDASSSASLRGSKNDRKEKEELWEINLQTDRSRNLQKSNDGERRKNKLRQKMGEKESLSFLVSVGTFCNITRFLAASQSSPPHNS